MLSTSKLKSYPEGNAFSYKLRRSNLALTSFAAISSLLNDAVINQNGGSSLEFQSNMKQKIFDRNCLKLYDK